MIAAGNISLCAGARLQRFAEKAVAVFGSNRPRPNISGAECPKLPKRLVIKVPPGSFCRDRLKNSCANGVSQFLSRASLKRRVFAAQAQIIGIQRNLLGTCSRGIHTPETDLAVGLIVEESKVVHVRANGKAIDLPRIDFAHHPETVKAEPDIRTLTNVDQTAGAVFQFQPANLKFGPVAGCSVEFQETCLEIEFLFVDGPGTGETKRVDPTLQFEKRADVLAVMKIEVRHVPLVEVPIHERLLSPIVIAYLLPHVSDLATDCHVPIFSVAAQRDVFDRIPEILTKARIAQKGPVLIFPQQFVSAIRRLLLRSTLGVCLCGCTNKRKASPQTARGRLYMSPRRIIALNHRASSGR